jgi:hypothetical protein
MVGMYILMVGIYRKWGMGKKGRGGRERERQGIDTLSHPLSAVPSWALLHEYFARGGAARGSILKNTAPPTPLSVMASWAWLQPAVASIWNTISTTIHKVLLSLFHQNP